MSFLKWLYVLSLTVFTTVMFLNQQTLHLKPFSMTDLFRSVKVVLKHKNSELQEEDAASFQLQMKSMNSGTSDESKSEQIEQYKKEEPLNLPFPRTTLSAKKLLQQQWVSDLQKILSEISPESPPVHIIVGNYEYREVMLNWLITAKIRINPPLTNIIVVSIDSPLCQLLNKRDITCLYVHWKDYLTYNLGEPFRLILVLRLTVIRLLNYWGYDAANLDTDALLLKNPESLYREFIDNDLVSGRGKYPFDLGRKWGATICGGVFMTRSTPNTGN